MGISWDIIIIDNILRFENGRTLSQFMNESKKDRTNRIDARMESCGFHEHYLS